MSAAAVPETPRRRRRGKSRAPRRRLGLAGARASLAAISLPLFFDSGWRLDRQPRPRARPTS